MHESQDPAGMMKGASDASVDSLETIEPFLEAKGIRLNPQQRLRIERYAELLLHWNRGINLVGDADRLYSRHLLDSLLLLAAPWPAEARRVLDVGSGAGLPGLVIAATREDLQVDSLEIVAKKVTFQQVAATALQLKNFSPLRLDVHQLSGNPAERGAYDVVISRAFAALGELMEMAAPLLRPGGQLWAMKGRKLPKEQAELPAALRARFHPSPVEFRYEAPELGAGGVTAIYTRSA